MKRSRSLSLLTALFIVMLAGASLFSLGPVPAAGAAAGCGCAGDYVNPAVKPPSVAQPATGSHSPGGTYTLAVSSNALTVTDANSGRTVLDLTGLTGDFHGGFSPNDSGFTVWTEYASGGHVALYDLSSKTPSHVVWNNDYLGAFHVMFSPHGRYFLVAAPANAQFTDLKIVDATTGSYAYNDQLPGNTDWGFSPDDQRLAIWTGTNNATTGTSTSTIILFDLSARRQVWRTDGAFGSASLAFSPHGIYLASAAITNGSQAELAVVPAAASGGANTPVFQDTFTLYAPPGKGKDTFGSAAWGFSPDQADSTFVYDAVTGQTGVAVVMVSLAARAAQHTFLYPNLVSGWWQFSPCGDVLGIVVQPNWTASVDVALYATDSGQPLASAAQFDSLNVSLKATQSHHVVTVDGTDYPLAKNTGHASCGSGGGNGNGNGNGGGNTGGGGSVILPCGKCYVPPAVLDDLQVSPIAVIAGGQVTGTLTTANGGAVSLKSSDPAAAPVPAVVDTTSGTTTFTITTGAVTTDTLVTISATAGGTTRTARFIVAAPCAASTATASSTPIAAAPINGHGGGADRPLIQVSVDPIVVTAGGTATGSLSLSAAANRDTAVMLSSGDPAAVSVPTSVTVTRGATTATFAITTHDVASDEFVSIVARATGYLTLGGTLAVVRPPALAALSLDPSSATGGTSVTGTVTLSGVGVGCQAQTVRLQSSNADVASVPASITVPAGSASATFIMQTNTVTSDVDVTISGSLNGTTRSANLTVQAPAPPSNVYNDNFADAATLDLPGSAIGDTNLATMESGEPLLSGTCAVLSGHQMENSVWFKLTPTQSGVLTVSTANAGTNFDSVLALYADPGSGGVSSLGTPVGCDNNADALQSTDSGSSNMTLRSEEHTGPAPDKGTLGGLPTWSSIMHVSVTAGQTYYLQLGGVGGAPAGHYVLTAEVNPALPLPSMLAGVNVDPANVASGGSVTGTVTLSGPAPAGGITVALSASDPTTASVPEDVVVPEGADHATFTVQTRAVTAATMVTVTASFDGAQQSADLNVSAP